MPEGTKTKARGAARKAISGSISHFLQFRGRWYVVGLAGNAVQKEKEGGFTMYSTIYELQENNSYNVTSILVR